MQLIRTLPLGMALAASPLTHRGAHVYLTASNQPPALSTPEGTVVAPSVLATPDIRVNPIRRDVDQVLELVPYVGAAGALSLLLTFFLAPLTGGIAHGVKLIFAGAIAGIISRTFCAPLEMISTVVMCGKGGSLGIFAALAKIWREEGIKGLFKGNGANCLKVAPSRGLQFLVYENVKRMLVLDGGLLTPQMRLFAAGIAGMVAAAVVYPLDVAKTLLTLYPDKCKSIPSAFSHAAKSGGITGLYRGLGPTLVAMFPYVGVEFMVYECLKVQWELISGGPAGTLALLLLGAIGGAASQTVAHPLDVVRRRLQMLGMRQKDGEKPAFTNMLNGLYTIGKKEGLPTLYRGLAPTCLEKVPSTAISYYIYEGMKVALKVTSV